MIYRMWTSLLPKPSGQYAVGFVDFECEIEEIPVLARLYYPTKEYGGSLGSWLPSTAYFPSYGYYLRIPLMLYTPVARLTMGGVKQWAVEDDLPIDKFLGTVIFSHGLAGIRTTYSTICTEMASQGYAVVAIEHRDGSASMTISRDGVVKPYKYINAEVEDEMGIRKEQLNHRCKEVDVAIRCIERLNEGLELTNLYTHGKREVNSLAHLKGRFTMEEIHLMGHSFGAATMLRYAAQSARTCSVIALDPWMYTLPLMPEVSVRGKFDLMVIDMEQFQWPENLAKIKALIEAWAKRPAMYTVINGAHMQCSDIPFLRLASYMMKKGAPPTTLVLDAINQLCLTFLLEKKVSDDLDSKFDNLLKKM